MTVSAGGDGRAQSGLRVRPDEGEPAEDDAQPTRPHIPRDQDGQRSERPLRAVRALEVRVLHERDRRVVAAEREPVLWDAGEEPGLRRRRLGRVARAELARRDERHREGGGARDDGDELRPRHQCDIEPATLPTLSRPT
jgi:hypothetical protein